MNYPNITFDNASPEVVDSHKHLGVYSSSNAKWDTQINFIINKCAKMCFSLNSLPVDLNSLIYGNDTLTDTQNEILFGIVQNYIKETKRFV